jgi:cytochrome P450
MEGDKWREMRHKLSPTFTSGKIKGMFPLVEACAENLNKFAKLHLGQVDLKVSSHIVMI